MADKDGYKRGAKGIDGTKGSNFTDEGRSESAEKAMYGQGWWGEDGTKDITGETGMGTNGSGGKGGHALARDAVGGKRKIGGR